MDRGYFERIVSIICEGVADMKVLITGAGGNLGRVLAPVLEEKGYEPILIDTGPLKVNIPLYKVM